MYFCRDDAVRREGEKRRTLPSKTCKKWPLLLVTGLFPELCDGEPPKGSGEKEQMERGQGSGTRERTAARVHLTEKEDG